MSGREITDPALIAELEKGAQSGDDVVVQALIDGRMSFPTDGRALNKPYWQNLVRQVSAKDPTFDTIDYKARSRTRQAFTSGKEAQNITSFNTLLHHIGTLEKAAGELDNYGGVFTPLNSIANRASETTGSPKLTTFRTARDAVAREAVRAFRGVGGTGADVEETVRNIPENGSPEQIRASVKTLADLLRGRIQSLGEQYTAGMGKTSDGINLLDDEAKDVLGRLSPAERRDDQAGGAAAGTNGGQPPSGSPKPPAGNIDIGFGDRSAADANGRPSQSDAYVREVNQGIRDGSIADVDALTAVMAKYGASPPDRQKLVDMFEALKKGAPFGGANPLEYAVDISDDRGKSAVGDTVKAFARGVPAVLGLDDEVNAAADVVLDGADWSQSLSRERAIRNYDEDNHFWARLGGEVVGGMGIEAGIARAAPALTAEAAARIAGRSMIRAGGTRAEALRAANQAYAIRLTQQGAAIGGIQGVGSSDGGIGNRVLGGVAGTVIGGAVGGATGKVAGRFRTLMDARTRAVRQPQVNEAAEIVSLADQQGISIMPQDVGGPGVGRMTQSAAQTPFGSKVVREASDRLYDSFRNRVATVGGEADTLADVGGTLKARSAALAEREGARAENTSAAVQDAVGVPDDPTGAGQIVHRGVNRFMDETADRANQLYARVPIPAASEANVSATRGMLRDLNAGMRSNPELGAMFESPRLQGYLRALTPRTDEQTGEVMHAGTLSWQDLQEFRTRVGDMLDDPRLSDKIAPRQLRALYGALSEDMEATARGQGENALRSWRRANTYYAARMRRVNDTLSMVVGDRRDTTPNEAMAKLQTMLRTGSGENAASFGRVMRSIPTEDARVVRATIVNDIRGSRQFDAAELAKRWDQLSERGKSALLPETGLRSIMDDAADRAASSSRDPLAKLSGEQAYLSLEKLANNRGDSAEFRRRLAALSPSEASAVRSLFVNRMGLAGAGAQNAEGDAFSIARFLTRWNDLTPQAKHTLFGDAEMRNDMNALATIAERVKGSEKLRGHSNTGGIDIANKTGMGLASAVIALATGHPIVAAGLAAPPLYQRLSAEVLTSKAMLRWLARTPKKPNVAAQRAHIQQLGKIASAEPAIANEVLQFQTRLRSAFASPLPTQIAAEERLDRRPAPEQGRRADQPSQQLGASAH